MSKNLFLYTKGNLNGYAMWYHNNFIDFTVYDMGIEIESFSVNVSGKKVGEQKIKIDDSDMDLDLYIKKNKNLYDFIREVESKLMGGSLIDVAPIEARLNKRFNEEEVIKMVWVHERKIKMEKGMYEDNNDFMPYYLEQRRLQGKIIKENELPDKIDLIAGADVAYSEKHQKMIGAVSVLDAKTLESVEDVYSELPINFPYIPGLFSFREVPAITDAFKKLKNIPQLIICDAHGIAHPKGIGMASHLGLELDIPTIGCAKRRLVGYYDKETLGAERGSKQSLIWDSKEVGVALRTQTNIKPVFVSIGHKIDLKTSIEWVLKLCPKYRIPETTRQADQLVNKLMKERTKIDPMDDDPDEDI